MKNNVSVKKDWFVNARFGMFVLTAYTVCLSAGSDIPVMYRRQNRNERQENQPA